MNETVRVQPWHNPAFDRAGITADVLRLDELHSLISGNKWLKLKGFLEAAKNNNKIGILTGGGPWSNHIHASAYAAKLFGLSCHLWVRSYELLETATLIDCAKWGATLRRVNRSDFQNDKLAMDYAEANNLQFIPMGGSGPTGEAGVTDFITALNLPAYTHAVCGIGTGTTLAGLLHIKNNFPALLGIESGTGDKELAAKINAWQSMPSPKQVELVHGYTFGGFSKYTPELIVFMNQLYLENNIPSDVVYTAKMFFAVRSLAQGSTFATDSRLLLIHSGGLQGNRSLPPSILQF